MIHESVFRRVKFSKSVISLGEFYKYVKQYYEKHSRLILTREIFSKMSVINLSIYLSIYLYISSYLSIYLSI